MIIIYSTSILIIAIIAFLLFAPTFGASPDKKSAEKIMHSDHFNGKVFMNLIRTQVMIKQSKENKSMLKEMFFSSVERSPKEPLPTKQVDKDRVVSDSFTWLGHSTVLFKTGNATIITDPVFSRASPVPFFGKPFKMTNTPSVKDLPKINMVILSHDHYDHLEYKTIKKLGNSVDKYLVPLGVKAHLVRWGVDEHRVVEKDWYENITYKNVTYTLVPSRHFSGRRFSNRNTTLWGGWVIQSATKNIYFSGDGGYSPEFEKIGERFGPFDIAFVENGAYNDRWKEIHMMPEESVRASSEVNAKIILPIHWAKFSLAPHAWDEPILRFMKEAKKYNLTVTTPLIGETFSLDKLPQDEWWK